MNISGDVLSNEVVNGEVQSTGAVQGNATNVAGERLTNSETLPVAAEVTQATRLQGHLREVNPVRGYCFVRTDDGRDFFVHCTEVQAAEMKTPKFGTAEFKPTEISPAKGGAPWRRLMREGRLAEFTPVDNDEARKTNPRVRDRALHVVVLS